MSRIRGFDSKDQEVKLPDSLCSLQFDLGDTDSKDIIRVGMGLQQSVLLVAPVDVSKRELVSGTGSSLVSTALPPGATTLILRTVAR